MTRAEIITAALTAATFFCRDQRKAACDNIRIFKSKIFSGNQYRGYIASKKRFFSGSRYTSSPPRNKGPVEFLFAPRSEADMKAFTNLDLDLAQGARIYADKISKENPRFHE